MQSRHLGRDAEFRGSAGRFGTRDCGAVRRRYGPGRSDAWHPAERTRACLGRERARTPVLGTVGRGKAERGLMRLHIPPDVGLVVLKPDRHRLKTLGLVLFINRLHVGELLLTRPAPRGRSSLLKKRWFAGSPASSRHESALGTIFSEDRSPPNRSSSACSCSWVPAPIFSTSMTSNRSATLVPHPAPGASRCS